MLRAGTAGEFAFIQGETTSKRKGTSDGVCRQMALLVTILRRLTTGHLPLEEGRIKLFHLSTWV